MARNYVRGIPQTREALRALKDIVNRPMAEAGRAALLPALHEAKATVPRDEGHLQSRLSIVQVPTGDRLRVRLLLGPSGRSKKEHSHLALVASLLEFGRAPNEDSGKGCFAPIGWLRSVYERQKHQIVDRYIAAYGPAIDRQIARIQSRKPRG
jgi:hypothetical protein